MITTTRRQVRRLRGVFRRHVLGISHKGAIPPLIFRAEGTRMRAQHRYAALAVEHTDSGPFHSHEAIALPLDTMSEFEGGDGSPVILEAAAPDRTIVRWEDHGVPQVREFTVPAIESLAPFVEPPASWATCPPDLIDAFADASATAAAEATRYAFNCLQLRGEPGEVVATDGRQLLIRGGFRFPWGESLLIRASPSFACRELPRDQPVMIGRTGTHVVLRAGPWSLYLEIQIEGRFPDLDSIIPDPANSATRLKLDLEDARFLEVALSRLPGSDESNAPATLDLNGKIAVRARSSDQSQSTELVLSRSAYTGTPVRLNTDRVFLNRALRLGFSEIEISDAASPLVCRDPNRIFCWQPLSQESAIPPGDDDIHIVSLPPTITANVRSEPPTKARIIVNQPTDSTRGDSRVNGPAPGVAVTDTAGATGLVALIQEAEALHETLTDARSRTGRLIVALRRHRKQSRLVQSTLASLRQLKLQEITE